MHNRIWEFVEGCKVIRRASLTVTIVGVGARFDQELDVARCRSSVRLIHGVVERSVEVVVGRAEQIDVDLGSGGDQELDQAHVVGGVGAETIAREEMEKVGAVR